MGILHGLTGIVGGNLVLCIDPANTSSIPEDKRTTPLTDGGVKDMMRNISSIDVDNSTDAGGSSYLPYWNASNHGKINFYSTGAGEGTSFKYGFLDLGTPVNGVTQFGETGCYTVDIWWRQLAIDSDYIYQGGHIFGPRDVYTSYTNWSNRTLVYGSFSITINGGTSGSYDYYSLLWYAGQATYSSGGNDRKFYSAGSGTILTPEDEDFPWTHHCCVFDLGDSLGSGSQIYTYINGSPANTGSNTTFGSATWKTNTTNGGNIYIGASDRNGTDETIKKNGARGDMGPFKIYNRALTAAEVKQNFVAVKWRYGL